MWKRIWADPVWSKVITSVVASAIVALAGSLTYLADLWPEILSTVRGIWVFAKSSSAVLNWLLVISAWLAASGLVVIWFVRVTSTDPAYKMYCEDVFLKMRWRWRYGSDPSDIQELSAFCLGCDLQLRARDVAENDAMDRIQYFCEVCEVPVAEFQDSDTAIEDLVMRQIQRKLRKRSEESKDLRP